MKNRKRGRLTEWLSRFGRKRYYAVSGAAVAIFFVGEDFQSRSRRSEFLGGFKPDGQHWVEEQAHVVETLASKDSNFSRADCISGFQVPERVSNAGIKVVSTAHTGFSHEDPPGRTGGNFLHDRSLVKQFVADREHPLRICFGGRLHSVPYPIAGNTVSMTVGMVDISTSDEKRLLANGPSIDDVGDEH